MSEEIPQKPWWQSKTVLASIIVVVAGAFHLNVSLADAGDIAGQLDGLITIVFALIAIFGRISAKSKIVSK